MTKPRLGVKWAAAHIAAMHFPCAAPGCCRGVTTDAMGRLILGANGH
jgi:hypothetical protein